MIKLMDLTQAIQGHEVYYILKPDLENPGYEKQFFFYKDNDEPADYKNPRSCKKCGKHKTKEGHDACIASLPGVKFACCGHGVGNCIPYIAFENGLVWRGGGVDIDSTMRNKGVYVEQTDQT